MQNNLQTKEVAVQTGRKFRDAEQLWFWFLTCKNISSDLNKNAIAGQRICDPIDIEITITKLYLCGKLSNEQLTVLKNFGDRRRAPSQYIWSENKDAALWTQAMNTITDAVQIKGWI